MKRFIAILILLFILASAIYIVYHIDGQTKDDSDEGFIQTSNVR